MARFTLRLYTGNAAFDDDEGAEVARILHQTALKVAAGVERSGKLYDINGNTVGEFKFTGRRPS